MKNKKIAIIGLGYVGLPLAVEFGKKREVIGFDINKDRIVELKKNNDSTLEITQQEFKDSIHLSFTTNLNDLKNCNIFIVTVPTPIDKHKRPDLTALEKSSETVGAVLKRGDIVIYESTVYPGATEEICIPILESVSNLNYNREFFCGYSPERINPGDKEHKITNILKVVSGSTPKATDYIESLYSSIIKAGTVRASSIKVAEAAKVIENTQRDVNIGLINELATIFQKLSIDTEEVLEAAGTKWNFLPFRPGLVGGHCIGVDPYYLSYKSQSVGYEPEMILAGRKINDGMSKYIALELIKNMIKKDIKVKNSKILVMGLTFKENCPDTRNTKVLDLIDELKDSGALVDTLDPWVQKNNLPEAYQDNHLEKLSNSSYSAVIFAVAHDEFKNMDIANIKLLCKPDHIIYDLKYMFPSSHTDMRL